MNSTPSNITDANLQPGDKVDKYEIVGVLGVGGMSRVWKAVDRLLDRPIAVKQLTVDLKSADNVEALRERFRQEAELQKRVSGLHKNLVKVIDLVEDPRGLFLLMEYVEGQSLETYLNKRSEPMDSKTALVIVGSVAQALAVLHEQGVVHRDLKPANVLLPKVGGVKVCDFGLATLMDDPTTPELGTVRYMAPECFSQTKADARSDMYALGMMAYEMLVGRDKFNEVFKTVVRDQRNQALRWMKWHTNLRTTAEPLSEVNPQVPVTMSELVARLMEKDASKRIGTANELLEAIRRHFQTQGGDGSANLGQQSNHTSTASTSNNQVVASEASTDPTAAIPKANRKPVMIGAAIAAVVMLGLAIWGYSAFTSAQQAKTAREAAQKEYAAALDQYKQGNFRQALPMFETIAKQWQNDKRLSNFSRAHALMAEGELLYADGQFAAAENKYLEAERIGLVAESFAGLDRDLLKKRINESRTRLSVINIVSEIESFIAKEQFTDARERLQRTLRVSGQSLTPEESGKLAELGARIEGQERQTQITNIITRARELAEVGQRDEALAFLDTSLKRYPHRELQQLSAQLRREIELEKVLNELTVAESSGDWPVAARAARRALQLRRDDAALRARLNTVLSRSAYERGRKLEQDGDVGAARAAYLEATGLSENKPASEALARITTVGQQDSLLKAAEDAAAQNNWDAAIRHYEKALEIGPNVDAAAKLKIARLNQKAEQARALIDDGELAKARTMLTEVIQADGEHPLATVQVDRLVRLQEYQTAVQRGDALRKESRFGDAMREYRKAREVRDTPEVKQRLDEVEYESWLAQARREISVRNWQAANSALLAARNIRVTDEVDKLLADVSEAMKK